ncbi:MAG: flagellar basal-body rod protein FlgF [Alphaproteobacteria bacterium]
MENASYIALSHQVALHDEMAVIANNIANVGTPGFRREGLVFAEFLAKPGKPAARTETLSYVNEQGLARNVTSGPIEETGSALDVAIAGDAFFVVDTRNGQRFTRSGHFRLDPTGQIITQSGDVVQGANGPLIIPPDASEISIADDGMVSTDRGTVGQMQLVRFDNDRQLEKTGNGLYRTNAAPQPVTNVSLIQGSIERANVQPVLEITRMIEIMRLYQSNQNLIQMEHERQKRVIETLPSMNG